MRLLLRLSRERPLLLILEDLHWLDAETQAVLDELVERQPAARMLLLVNYRPEYSHGWGSKGWYTQIRVDPLPEPGTAALLDSLLGADPSLGLLGVQSFLGGRTILAVQYWRSFDHLQAFARSKDHEHLPAWREFNRLVRDNGDVGIFHETYRVGPGTAESFFGNMPLFGLGAAVGIVPAGARGHSAARRMGTTTTDVPALEPY